MSRVETLENEVTAFSSDEMTKFREWFADFDAAQWDRQIEQDVAKGKLDILAARALSAHRSGATKPL